MESEFFVSTGQSKQDVGAIHNFLSKESHWAGGRSLRTVEKSITHSLCFGVLVISETTTTQKPDPSKKAFMSLIKTIAGCH